MCKTLAFNDNHREWLDGITYANVCLRLFLPSWMEVQFQRVEIIEKLFRFSLSLFNYKSFATWLRVRVKKEEKFLQWIVKKLIFVNWQLSLLVFVQAFKFSLNNLVSKFIGGNLFRQWAKTFHLPSSKSRRDSIESAFFKRKCARSRTVKFILQSKMFIRVNQFGVWGN